MEQVVHGTLDPYNLHEIWNDSCYHRDNLREINVPRQDCKLEIYFYNVKTVEPISPFTLAKEHFEWNEE